MLALVPVIFPREPHRACRKLNLDGKAVRSASAAVTRLFFLKEFPSAFERRKLPLVRDSSFSSFVAHAWSQAVDLTFSFSTEFEMSSKAAPSQPGNIECTAKSSPDFPASLVAGVASNEILCLLERLLPPPSSGQSIASARALAHDQTHKVSREPPAKTSN